MPDRPASELLRELGAGLDEAIDHLMNYDGDYDNAEKVARARRALPAFIALVEAADPDAPGSSHWMCMGSVTMLDGHKEPCSLCAALADLRRELGGGA